MGNITLTEWKELVSGDDLFELKINEISSSIELVPSYGDGLFLVPKWKTGSSLTLDRDPTVALMQALDIVDTLRAVGKTWRKVRHYMVWPDGDCPCDHCRGRGETLSVLCSKCSGKGKR